MEFKLHSDYAPTGDQPKAIETLAQGVLAGKKHQTLMGVTGSGKTFTMANIIEKVQKPTLVISHNKTLAAQLHGEFKEFFPETCTSAEYSASGSQTMISSSVIRKQFVISLFAEKDLPEPGVPRISPFGFFKRFRSTIIMLLDNAFSP